MRNHLYVMLYIKSGNIQVTKNHNHNYLCLVLYQKVHSETFYYSTSTTCVTNFTLQLSDAIKKELEAVEEKMSDPINLRDPDLQLHDTIQELLSIAEVQVQT